MKAVASTAYSRVLNSQCSITPWSVVSAVPKLDQCQLRGHSSPVRVSLLLITAVRNMNTSGARNIIARAMAVAWVAHKYRTRRARLRVRGRAMGLRTAAGRVATLMAYPSVIGAAREEAAAQEQGDGK